MKVFLSTDMEGTAGVVAWEQCVGDGPDRPATCRAFCSAILLTRLIAEAV
jgi:D-aminopeptidase